MKKVITKAERIIILHSNTMHNIVGEMGIGITTGYCRTNL